MLATQQKSETTVAGILGAARTLFVAHSYAAVTMSGVARECGVTKGAIYHHFPGKEALYMAMLLGDLAEKRRLFLAAIQPSDGCRARLCRLTLAYFRLPARRRQMIRLVRRDVNVFLEPARGELVHAYQAALPEPVESVLRAGMEAGEIAPGDPRLLSWQFVALVETTLTMHADRVLPQPEEKVEQVLDLFLSGAARRGG